MSGQRTVLFLVLYAAIIAAMLFVFLFVQARYGADTSGPYKRRFLDKFFLEAPVHPSSLLALSVGSEKSDGPTLLNGYSTPLLDVPFFYDVKKT